MLDYETLRFIWWLLTALSRGIYGNRRTDMGVCCLLPLIARNDDETAGCVDQ